MKKQYQIFKLVVYSNINDERYKNYSTITSDYKLFNSSFMLEKIDYPPFETREKAEEQLDFDLKKQRNSYSEFVILPIYTKA